MLGKKKYNNTLWKTASGEYECKPGTCPPGMCDSDKCPIKLWIIADNLMEMSEYAHAERFFATAASIAPDCAEINFSLGVCRSKLGKHEQARDSYRAALLYKADYPEASEMLAKEEKIINGGLEGVENIDWLYLYGYLYSLAIEHNDAHKRESADTLTDRELAAHSHLFETLYPGLKKYAAEKNENWSPLKMAREIVFLSIYAGIGAVLEWHRDRVRLNGSNLIELLAAKRDIYHIDEYVVELFTGETYDSKAGIFPKSSVKFERKMEIYRNTVIDCALSMCKSLSDLEKDQYLNTNMPELSRGCYYFGKEIGFELLRKQKNENIF